MGEINTTLDSARAKTKQWMYYFIVGIVSLITLVFLPMIGSTAGLAWAIPNTAVGWIVWVAIKLIVAALNVIIFHCFVQQGKLNVKDHPDFKEAKNILETITAREEVPMSPSQWTRKTYLTKGVTVFITTALGAVALSQAILKVLPEEEKTKYLQKDISLDAPINYLIQRDGKGDKNTAPVVNKIVKHAKDKGIKIDLNEFGEKSENPMPLHLRQMFMVACKLNDVEYSPVNGEKINMSSDYVKSLPNDIQAILVAKNMKDAKNQMNNNPQVRNQQNTRG